jgi:signal transduction histidine kinase
VGRQELAAVSFNEPYFVARVIKLVVFVIAAWACWQGLARSQLVDDTKLIVSITQALLTEQSDASTKPSSAPRIVNLPALERRSPRDLTHFKLQAEFEIPDTKAASLWAVYFVHLYDGGRVSINGRPVAEVQTSTVSTTVRNVRPYNFPIPMELLRDGTNRLELTWTVRESSIISRVLVGPAEVVAKNYDRRFFWQNTMAQVAFVYALVIALILLGTYSLRRHQLSYRQLGMSAIGIAIVVFVYILPAMPAEVFPYWRFIHIVGISLYSQGAWLFIISEVQPENRWYPRLCAAVGLLGPAVYLVNYWLNDVSFMPDFERVWGLLTGVDGLYAMAVLAISLYKQATWRKFIFLTTTLIAFGFSIGDILLRSSGSSIFGSLGYSTQISAPLWLTALATVLMTDFIASLRNQDSQHKVMADQLRTQQLKMKTLHETNQLRERESATLQERQRIMSDIHDGLGSQLLSSLALSEKGALSKEQTNILLRECIDDLRLAIDAMSDDENQFEVAAGNLRFRLEPRLRAAGIQLSWKVTRTDDAGDIPHSATLPLLRILQECISNALRHSGAQRIGVSLQTSSQEFLMTVIDNGCGIHGQQASIGRGLNLMQKRARSIHANLVILDDAGTKVNLVLPLTL